MERETGLEPATFSLEGWRSSQLSYSRPKWSGWEDLVFRLTTFAHVAADSRRYRSGPSFQILQTCTIGMFPLITSTVSGILPIQTWSGWEDLVFRLTTFAAEPRTPAAIALVRPFKSCKHAPSACFP